MTTNQAFIKAYRHDAGVSKAAPGDAGSESAVPTPVFWSSPAGVGAAPPRTAEPANVATIGANVTYVTAGATWPYTPDVPEIEPPPRGLESGAATSAPHGPITTRRPLSSFTKQARVIPAPPGAASLRPGTTIASLRWPAVCRRLLAQHGQRFDHIADVVSAAADDGRSVVGVIGLFRGVGATTTLLCLAARLAARGRRVVLVDGHFQAPGLAACLDAELTAWWQDVLERGAPLADALIRAEDDDLDLLPLDPQTRTTPQPSAELQLSATAGALRHAYDVALVDLGTFFDPLSQPAALELVHHMRIDAALAVAEPARLDARDLATVAEYLGERGCTLLGAIENRVLS